MNANHILSEVQLAPWIQPTSDQSAAGGESADVDGTQAVEGQLYYAVLYKRPEHPQILGSLGGSWN